MREDLPYEVMVRLGALRPAVARRSCHAWTAGPRSFMPMEAVLKQLMVVPLSTSSLRQLTVFVPW